MRTADEIRKELAEAKQHLDDLLRTENESPPAEQDESYVDKVGLVEERVRELERELAAISAND